jgi:phosphoribosyl-ATP pyrophosphohydrolase/phosphoribosyl-AMP cyclohydrolase
VPAVVQDAADGRVLMVAYVDAEALAATLASGEVHFHSRSRDRLWRKGESSGNVLRLRDISIDCDGDALLIAADPVGPTCHRNTRSCFDPDGAVVPQETATAAATFGVARASSAEPSDQGFAWLETLWSTIDQRASARPATRDALTGEVADLLYHTLVVLRERDLPPSAVIARLRERHKA